MDFIDRFTEGARRALALSQDSAKEMGHNYVGSEHLLLGLASLEYSPAAQALRRAGATILGEETTPSAPLLTKADLFACGLSGGAGSREKRQALLRKLGLPAHLSPDAMLPVLSALYDRQTLLEEMRKL